MSDTLNKIKIKLAELEKKKEEALKSIRIEFPELFKDLFEKSILINSISWTQYTPYFMDGDECVFGVNADDLEVNNIDRYDDEDEDEPILNWIEEVSYRRVEDETDLKNIQEWGQTEKGKRYEKSSAQAKVGSYTYTPNPNYNKFESDVLNEMSDIINSIPEEFLRSLFGDHVKVTVYRDGRIETDGYEHE